MTRVADDLHVQERDLWGDEPDPGQPRCPVCGRFSAAWGADHDECMAHALAAEEAQLREEVESQGLVDAYDG